MVGLSLKARNSAFKDLRETHADEWETLIVNHRTALGLPAHPLGGETPEMIKGKIERAQKRIDAWTAKLNGNA